MSITLQPDDLQRLLHLTDEAKRTPVIALSMRDGLAGRDFASLAWDRVREYWKELGEKYGFNPEEVEGVHRMTGTIILDTGEG